MTMTIRLFLGAALALLASIPSVAMENGSAPDSAEQLRPEITAFEQWDSENSFPAHAVLFVGSSSINYWPTARLFPGLPVINRGFGGSATSDVLYYYDAVIGKYAPGKVVIYVGDNDITAGKSAERVTADLLELFGRIERDFPDARIYFLSIKASLQRWTLWPKMQDVNARIETALAADPRGTYVDVATPLLGADGKPDARYFAADGLHLNAEGYRVWTGLVSAQIDKPN